MLQVSMFIIVSPISNTNLTLESASITTNKKALQLQGFYIDGLVSKGVVNSHTILKGLSANAKKSCNYFIHISK